MLEISTLLFNQFETLDVFGPIELFGRLKENFKIVFYSENAGLIISSHDVPILTKHINEMPDNNFILFIPGGYGTRKEVDNDKLINFIKAKSEKANYILSVCTGTTLLAKSGILSGKKATTNKRVFNWVIQFGKDINWIKKARWIKDGNIYTSSGVSAGMDMALGFISDILNIDIAEKQSKEIEYIWNKDSENDPFAELYD